MSTQTQSRRKLNRELGVALALIGGVVAVGVGIYISRDAAYLWALLLVGFMLQRVGMTKSPATVGATMGALCLLLAGVIYYVGQPIYLWAIVLIGWVADYIASAIQDNRS